MKKILKEFFRLGYKEISKIFTETVFPLIVFICSFIYMILSIFTFSLSILGESLNNLEFIFALQPLIWMTIFLIFVCKWFIAWAANNWKQAKKNIKTNIENDIINKMY